LALSHYRDGDPDSQAIKQTFQLPAHHQQPFQLSKLPFLSSKSQFKTTMRTAANSGSSRVAGLFKRSQVPEAQSFHRFLADIEVCERSGILMRPGMIEEGFSSSEANSAVHNSRATMRMNLGNSSMGLMAMSFKVPKMMKLKRSSTLQ